MMESNTDHNNLAQVIEQAVQEPEQAVQESEQAVQQQERAAQQPEQGLPPTETDKQATEQPSTALKRKRLGWICLVAAVVVVIALVANAVHKSKSGNVDAAALDALTESEDALQDPAIEGNPEPDEDEQDDAEAGPALPWNDTDARRAFRQGYIYEIRNGNVVITCYYGNPTELSIPAEFEGLPVIAIENDFVFYFNHLKRLTIPDGMKRIGEGMFAGAGVLSDVTLPDTVTDIGAGAFHDTPWLNSQLAGATGDYFVLGDDIVSIYIGDGKEVSVPWELNHIDFYNNPTIQTVILEEGWSSVNKWAFRGCSGLTNVALPKSVTGIEERAFADCTSLKNLTLPDKVTYIGERAFYGCESLVSLTIPDSVSYIDKSAFEGCTSVKNLTLPGGPTKIEANAFRDCASLMNVTIPYGVTSIGDWGFSYCSSLKNITLPDSLQSIGHGAFEGCTSLESITIPESVQEIGSNIFPGYNTDIFGGCNTDKLIVHCSAGSYALEYAKKYKLQYVID